MTLNNKNDFFHSINPLIKVVISIEIATPLIPKKGANVKFSIIPINRQILAQKSVTFSFPHIIRISAADPNIELIKGESKIIKNVSLGI